MMFPFPSPALLPWFEKEWEQAFKRMCFTYRTLELTPDPYQTHLFRRFMEELKEVQETCTALRLYKAAVNWRNYNDRQADDDG